MENDEKVIEKPTSLLDLRLLMETFIDFERPQLEDYKFNSDDYQFELPQIELKSRYIYSYRNDALDAAIEDLNENVYPKLDSIITGFVKSYEAKELAPLLKSEEENGNYYYEIKKKQSAKLKFYVDVLEELTGKTYKFEKDFFEFKTALNINCLEEVLSFRYETFVGDIMYSLPTVEEYAENIITDCDRIEVSTMKNGKDVKAVEQNNLFEPLEEEGKEFNLFDMLNEDEEDTLENGIIERWGYDLTQVMNLLKADLLAECSDFLLDYAEEHLENIIGSFEDDLNEEWIPKEAILLDLIDEATLKEIEEEK